MECEALTLKETAEYLKGVGNALILTHSSPDGDTLGSAFALKGILELLGKKAEVVCGDKVSKKYSYLGKVAKTEGVETKGKTLIAVDVADKKLMSGIPEEIKDNVELCIDHHLSNKKYAKRLFLDDDAAACCEIMLSLCDELGIKPTEKIATAIFTGVVTDTGCFQFTNTTPKTHITAAKLMEMGADSEYVTRLFFETKSKGRLYLERKLFENLRLYFDGKCALTVLDYETLHSDKADLDELDGVSGIPRTIEGVFVGVTLKGKEEGKWKISVRTHAPVRADAICSALGGGGHIRAAGCEIKGDAETAINKILQSIEAELKNCEGVER